MKRLALLFSIFSLVFAFTVTTVSAQKATGSQKPATEKSACKSQAGDHKACSGDHKACCSDKAKSASCSQKCGDANKAGCAKDKPADEVPVPKKN